ncbi:hypothetical protein H9645_02165 [Luteimonas sp. Sa2BVA3]|uniref:Phosphatase PAP2 family protein n=1 Tax=Luteimonas colneyensis TaxID=2762230 RepID=A0ABR8UFP2_9GAMM|nr:hypothetical protein [Luteimonas colneyensis]MBD7986832.1 hypothetical protein [Luteimonas colneyensis]
MPEPGAPQRVARLVSILVHPVVAMLAAAAVATDGAASPALRWQALASVAAAATAVMLYSGLKTRSGRWAHVDASQRHERAQLNRFASWLLFVLAAGLAMAGVHAGIVATIALSGAIVLAGHLLRCWLKSSLHVAFAAFAACIAWPHVPATGVLLAATVAVAWSRLALRRHLPAEVLSGALLGVAAGAALHAIMRG